MPINKDKKVFLQIPVEKPVAKCFNDLAKELNCYKGDLFVVMFHGFCKALNRQALQKAKEQSKSKKID